MKRFRKRPHPIFHRLTLGWPQQGSSHVAIKLLSERKRASAKELISRAAIIYFSLCYASLRFRSVRSSSVIRLIKVFIFHEPVPGHAHAKGGTMLAPSPIPSWASSGKERGGGSSVSMVMDVRADLFRSAYEIMHEPKEIKRIKGGRKRVGPTEKKE